MNVNNYLPIHVFAIAFRIELCIGARVLIVAGGGAGALSASLLRHRRFLVDVVLPFSLFFEVAAMTSSLMKTERCSFCFRNIQLEKAWDEVFAVSVEKKL